MTQTRRSSFDSSSYLAFMSHFTAIQARLGFLDSAYYERLMTANSDFMADYVMASSVIKDSAQKTTDVHAVHDPDMDDAERTVANIATAARTFRLAA